MANQLKVNQQQAILSLKERGWSQRRVARELSLHRQTVQRYWHSEPPPAPGSAPPQVDSKCTISPAGKMGRKSIAQAHEALIIQKRNLGLTAQRIYQDLLQEVGFEGSYDSVKRCVRRWEKTDPPRVYRVESLPGEEAQVDFGTGAPLVGPEGRKRRPWLFRMVLSYSRKGYSECVPRQNTESFLRCLENGFRAFGGVPKTLNIDNLKAAVLKADWYDPELNPKLAEFCRHYGTVVMACRVRTPEHKGKTENNIKYVKSNALAGREFESVAGENAFLAQWESSVADQRIHGTTRQQVAVLFAQEQKALLPLPASLFPCFREAQRVVHRDSYVEVERAYYAVAPEYIGARLWVRWDARTVRIYNQRWQQLQLYTRLAPGKFSAVLGVGGGPGALEENLAYWLHRASVLGEACALWAKGLVDRRGLEAMRTLMGLVNLAQNHPFPVLNGACASALARGAWRLKDLRQLLLSPDAPAQLIFLRDHPLIRNLAEYGLFIQTQNHD